MSILWTVSYQMAYRRISTSEVPSTTAQTIKVEGLSDLNGSVEQGKRFQTLECNPTAVEDHLINEHIQMFLQSAWTKNTDPTHAAEHIANSLLNFCQPLTEQGTKNKDERTDFLSLFSCFSCQCLLVEPVTLACGHTLCKTCVETVGTVKRIQCTKCGSDSKADSLSINRLVASVSRKWFPNDYEVEKQKLEEVSRVLRCCNSLEVLGSLSNILKNSPNHVLALKSRSALYAQEGLYRQALKDAEKACQLKPSLPSVFHQKGLLLIVLGKHEDAVLCLTRCATLEPENRTYRTDLITSLTNLIASKSKNSGKDADSAVVKGKPTKTYKGLSINNQVTFSRPKRFGKVIKRTKDDPKIDTKADNHEDPVCNEDRSTRKRTLSKDYSLLSTDDSRSFNPKQAKRAKLEKHLESTSDLKSEDLMMDENELECKICYNLLFQPVTTSCGHTFCRECLQRCLDHRPACPFCCQEVNCAVETSRSVTWKIEEFAKQLFPSEYAARERLFTEMKEEWKKVGVDETVEVPIFVCMLVFPTLSYPLHIFEPKYRLMIRRCIELGQRMFGMCALDDDLEKGFADCGTILYIEKLYVLPDGRSIVQTRAGQRFRVITRGMKEGYNTAKVEWLRDEQPRDEDEVKELEATNSEYRNLFELWYNGLTGEQQTCITNAIGPRPDLQESVLSSNDGPAWLWWALAAIPIVDKVKVIILNMTSLNERLHSLRRFVEVMLTMTCGDHQV